MTNEDNPYGNLLQLIQKTGGANTAPFFIGTVVSPAPLTVAVGELYITQENMMINPALFAGYKRTFSLGTTGASGQTGTGGTYSHSHSMASIGFSAGEMTTLDGLSVGDKVVLLASSDGQQYILLCKVV